MFRSYIRNNITTVSISIFLTVYMLINYYKPSLLYNRDGSLRQFGLNNSKKTVFPAWLLALLISILSYVFVLYYLAIPKLLH